jgi:hypothetical protein
LNFLSKRVKFFIPGVPIATLWSLKLKLHAGVSSYDDFGRIIFWRIYTSMEIDILCSFATNNA